MTAKQELAEETRTEKAHPAAVSDPATPDTDIPDTGTPDPATPDPATPNTATTPGTSETSPEAAATGSVAAQDTAIEDAAGDERSSAEGKGGRVTRSRIVGTLAAMLVATIAATAVLQWISAAQAQDTAARLETERALRLEVSGAATAFSKALLSYDYQSLQATRATVAGQATGDFLATYDTAFTGAMAQVIVKLKATSLATVREVYLADVDEATAHAIVVVDQQVNTSEAIRSVQDSHLKISLVKEKGTWKVHDVTVLGAASEDQYDLNGDDEKKD
ncbi:hypothetical protein [Nonomuraea sp. NPDC002799]